MKSLKISPYYFSIIILINFFNGTRIEIVQFNDDAGGDLIEEQIFKGPIHIQLQSALNYLNGLSTTMLQKVPNQLETEHIVSFPYEAMKEALVNAVYHRSYEYPPEPIKVYLYPNSMEITSYPGPVRGIEMEHLQKYGKLPRVPNRNRRIGEFLQELKLAEGRYTGILKICRKMKENGSPEPIFEFDRDRTYFSVILPAHPKYIIIHSLRESAYLWATGEHQSAINNLKRAYKQIKSDTLLAQIIEYYTDLKDFTSAEQLFKNEKENNEILGKYVPSIAIVKTYLEQGKNELATQILANIPLSNSAEEITEIAMFYIEAECFQEAHKILANNFEIIKNYDQAIFQFVTAKFSIVNSQKDDKIKQRLYQETLELLYRAIQLTTNKATQRVSYFYLAQILDKLNYPETEIQEAYNKATEFFPNVPTIFQKWWQERKKK